MRALRPESPALALRRDSAPLPLRRRRPQRQRSAAGRLLLALCLVGLTVAGWHWWTARSRPTTPASAQLSGAVAGPLSAAGTALSSGVSTIQAAPVVGAVGSLLQPAVRTDAALQALIEGLVDEENGETAIAVRNLRSGATAAVNDRQVFPAASLAKVPILYEVYRQLEAGKLRRDTPVTITGDAIADGSGVLQAREGDRLTVDELLDLAVEVSDNTAARVLMREVGGVDAINRAMADLGLSHTRLYSDSRPNTTTAGEMALLLAAVAARAGSPQAAATPTTNSLAALLVLPQAQAWLTLGVPRGVTVAHKSGQLPNLRHDAAVVYAARGPYIVVGLTDHLADQGDGEAFLAHLSRAVYEYFAK